jgi:5-methylcytosine-specific restriction endonuclease McrA
VDLERQRAYNNKHYQAHKTEILRKQQERRKANIELRAETQRRWYEANAEQITARARARYAENPEREYARTKKWREKNPERAAELQRRGQRVRRVQMQNAASEFYTEAQVLDLYGVLCYLCGDEIDLVAPRRTGVPGWELGLHIEHVVPITAGGPDTLDNVRPSHGKCNLKKGKRTC